MNSRERILTALDSNRPDKVPIFETYINESSIVKLAKLLRPGAVKVKSVKERCGEERKEILDLYCLVVEQLGLDATCTNFSIGIELINENYGRDKFGTVYSLSEHGEPIPVDGPVKDRSEIKGFDMVDKLNIDDFANVQHVIHKLGKSKAHFVMITDPFKVSWRLRGGMQHLLTDYILDPGLVHDLARISTDFDMAAIDIAIKVGADGVIMVGDLAGEQTTMMSPDQFREYIKPYESEIVNYAHKKGIKIVKHSDGNIWSILDDFLEIGFDGAHPIQPQCMDIAEVKEYLGGRMCILGNIDCRVLLPFGTEEEVRQSVKETIEKAAPQGGYIITSSNSVHPGVKPENYITMVKTAHNHGIYNR